eukprot:gnl/Chilomastix_cuspidata/875.p1 GENE.gnl/Chilomastix_cuspidata/875~~gnl/Chilomastix_cuspidata/875.p1  ORF type:complete len:868 (+),score=277.40 gnl/Chilomastix_cuspidata/875:1006-3609(+)
MDSSTTDLLRIQATTSRLSILYSVEEAAQEKILTDFEETTVKYWTTFHKALFRKVPKYGMRSHTSPIRLAPTGHPLLHDHVTEFSDRVLRYLVRRPFFFGYHAEAFICARGATPGAHPAVHTEVVFAALLDCYTAPGARAAMQDAWVAFAAGVAAAAVEVQDARRIRPLKSHALCVITRLVALSQGAAYAAPRVAGRACELALKLLRRPQATGDAAGALLDELLAACAVPDAAATPLPPVFRRIVAAHLRAIRPCSTKVRFRVAGEFLKLYLKTLLQDADLLAALAHVAADGDTRAFAAALASRHTRKLVTAALYRELSVRYQAFTAVEDFKATPPSSAREFYSACDALLRFRAPPRDRELVAPAAPLNFAWTRWELLERDASEQRGFVVPYPLTVLVTPVLLAFAAQLRVFQTPDAAPCAPDKVAQLFSTFAAPAFARPVTLSQQKEPPIRFGNETAARILTRLLHFSARKEGSLALHELDRPGGARPSPFAPQSAALFARAACALPDLNAARDYILGEWHDLTAARCDRARQYREDRLIPALAEAMSARTALTESVRRVSGWECEALAAALHEEHCAAARAVPLHDATTKLEGRIRARLDRHAPPVPRAVSDGAHAVASVLPEVVSVPAALDRLRQAVSAAVIHNRGLPFHLAQLESSEAVDFSAELRRVFRANGLLADVVTAHVRRSRCSPPDRAATAREWRRIISAQFVRQFEAELNAEVSEQVFRAARARLVDARRRAAEFPLDFGPLRAALQHFSEAPDPVSTCDSLRTLRDTLWIQRELTAREVSGDSTFEVFNLLLLSMPLPGVYKNALMLLMFGRRLQKGSRQLTFLADADAADAAEYCLQYLTPQLVQLEADAADTG